MSEVCCKCGRALHRDEIAFHKKAFDPQATEFLCIKCAAERAGLSEEAIREKIDYLKKSGCTLFFM